MKKSNNNNLSQRLKINNKKINKPKANGTCAHFATSLQQC